MKAPKRRLVLVVWHDAIHAEHGWVDSLDFKHKNDVVHSVGFVVRKGRRSITLAQSDGINTVANTLQIPRRMIEKTRTLR